MQQCVGVVLVLDEEATATRRSWCCFEEVVIPAVYFTSILLRHSLELISLGHDRPERQEAHAGLCYSGGKRGSAHH